MIALIIIASIIALLALIAVRIAASPLFVCVARCFGSWAEASRGEPFSRS
ncbi:MAG: hypothetical protein ABIP91_05720 [Sphingomicrobium sp.]